MYRKIFLIYIFSLFCIFFVGNNAHAGFGVSPPQIKNEQIIPGSKYRQEIRLLRSSADEDLQASIKVRADKINSWISIDKGDQFILPKGQLQVPITVFIDVPDDAPLASYRGYISIKVAPVNKGKTSGVAIALGARVDVDLSLTNISHPDFKVRLVSVPDFEVLGSPWNLDIWYGLFEKFFYKAQVKINIENTGNIKVSPSKVKFDVYDLNTKELIESSVDSSIKDVKPYKTEEIVASFPTKLKAGQYGSHINIYKGNKIVNFYEIPFTIGEHGSLGGDAPKLGTGPWILMFVIILLLLFILFVLIKVKAWEYLFIFVLFLVKPIINIILSSNKKMKDRFWAWLNKKVQQKMDKNK